MFTMKKLTIKLNQSYKSFVNEFHTTLEGNLIILSGVNGAGKSQIINIILGQDKANTPNETIQSTIKIDDIEIKKENIDFRSFKENISTIEIAESTAQAFAESANIAWNLYQQYSPNFISSFGPYLDSFFEAKKILLQCFSEQQFYNSQIQEAEFKRKLENSNFVIRAGDRFTNNIGEIFFAHAVSANEKMKEVSKAKFDPSMIEEAPWKKLNNLFADLKIDYRFKDNYEIIGVVMNEQPKLYMLKPDGTLDEGNSRNLADLSDGEKTIISLCFAALNSNYSTTRKLLLLDELDAVLNPSLIQIFFAVIQKYFIDQGVMVIMATHSPATISLSPDNATYYEIFRPNKMGERILEVSRNEYSELQIANKDFYDKIADQEKRIKSLYDKITDQGKRIESLFQQINSDQKILILTEGKTDWKYMLAALRHYHKNKEFLVIEEDFFCRFGQEKDVTEGICGSNVIIKDMGDAELNKRLESLRKNREIDKIFTTTVIGIFDSDGSNITPIDDKEKKVFSFKIVPNNISTEFLFNDNEIKTEVEGKRLYITDEFSRSKRNSADPNLNYAGDKSISCKQGIRKIIDSDVYNVKGENVALTKDNFAQAILKNEVKISDESWDNFRHIFKEIQSFIDIGNQKSINDA